MRKSIPLLFLLSVALLMTAADIAAPAQAARNLITQSVVDADLVPLEGQVSSQALAGKDLGPASGDLSAQHLILLLNRTPEQQQALDALVDQLHNTKSPIHQQWLTPQQFGQQFGASDSDVNTLVDWLQSKGFHIDDVVPGRTHIIFSGTVAQVQQAFHTEIHSILLNGQQVHANLTDPQIPAALAPLVKGFRQLSDFRAKPLKRDAGVFQRDRATGVLTQVSGPLSVPEITYIGAGRKFYSVTPQDFYTIYNVNPLLQAGINGAGVTIAVIEETNVTYTTDVDSFRSQFGLPAYPATPNSTQGGINWIIGPGNGCSTVGVTSTDEEAEALLDVEWAGAIAPNATIDFVACATEADNIGSYGTDLAASYIANYLASTVSAASLSYGECELATDATGASFYSALWQQMVAEGITPIVASGDAGSTGCDQNADYAANNVSVNVIASTPYNISAGGTDFSDAYQTVTYTTSPNIWWNENDIAPYGSALSYVPEIPWGGYCANPLFGSYLKKINFTLFGTDYTPLGICNNANAQSYLEPIGGGGGVSIYNNIPTWQSVYGVGLANVSTTKRNQPDVSLFASAGWWNHTLLFCQSDTGVTCDYSDGSNDYALGAGGTSFVAPQLNGLMALIVQKTGARQGNANYTLYGLAAQEYGTPGNPNTANLANCSGSGLGVNVGANCIFRDIAADTPSLQGGTITSDIVQACWWSGVQNCWRSKTSQTWGLSSLGNHPATDNPAYQSASGYDLATGLGSLNITNLVNNWNNLASDFATTTAASASPTTINVGDNTTLTATVSEIGRGGDAPPSGVVNFYIGGINGTLLGTAPIVPAVSPTNQAIGSLVVPGTALAVGANSIIAYFPGDGANDAPSTSSVVTVTVNKQAQTISFPSISDQQYGAAPFALNATATSGLTVTYTVISGPATVAGNIVTITGTGAVTIEADQAGNNQYLAASPVRQSFNINKATLTVTADSFTINYHQQIPKLTYTMTGFVYSDTQANATTGAPILSTWAMTTTVPGKYPISIGMGSLASANYKFTLVGGTITILKVTPVITWNPSTHTIKYGTALGSGILDATVNGIAGSFKYTTTVNGLLTTLYTSTVLPVGTYTITATFTPSDTAGYSTATAQQTITVTP